MELQPSKSGDGPQKDMVAEYLKARIGKTPYEGPTEAPPEMKQDVEIKKESMDKACNKCGSSIVEEGSSLSCSTCLEGMKKESAYITRKAINILKQAMVPPPQAQEEEQDPSQGYGQEDMSQYGGEEDMSQYGGGEEDMSQYGGQEDMSGGQEGLMPLPMLLEQLQMYMMMMQQQQQGGQ